MPGMQLLNIKSQRRLFQMNQLERYHKETKATPQLQTGNWCPVNRRILNDWLAGLQNHPNRHSMIAVFDFDNTCTYRDVGNAVFRFQLAGLHFRLPPKKFSKLFPKNQTNICGQPFKPIKKRILSLYKKLWPLINKKQHSKVLAKAEHIEFQDLFFWYCKEARKDRELGALYTLPLMSRLLAGYTKDEVENLTYRALLSAEQESIAIETRSTITRGLSPDIFFQIELAKGLQVHREIIDLMDQLQHCGIRSCIVSASTEWVVKAAVKHFRLPVNQEDIFGIRVQLDGNTLTKKLASNYPITYRTGKVAVINEIICATPIMIAGDAVTDYEMLNIPDVPIRLIINHNNSGLISTLYDDTRFLLQGLNKATGSFHPYRETCEAVYDQPEKSKWCSA